MDSNLLECATLTASSSGVAGDRSPRWPVDQNALQEKYDVFRTILLQQFFAVIWTL